MNSQHLKYFVSIARSGSFKTAAESEFCSTQCLYQAIGKLEKELGHPLFERSSDPLRLTAYGQWFLQHYAEPFLETCERMENSYQEFCKRQQEPLTIEMAGAPTRYRDVISQAAERFHQRHPEQRALYKNTSPQQVIAHVKDGSADIGFLWNTPHSDGLKRYMALPIEMGVYVSPAHPLAAQKSVTVSDMLEQPLWFFNATIYKNLAIWRLTGIPDTNALIAPLQHPASRYMYASGRLARVAPIIDMPSQDELFQNSLCLPFDPPVMEQFVFVTADCCRLPRALQEYFEIFTQCCDALLGIRPTLL